VIDASKLKVGDVVFNGTVMKGVISFGAFDYLEIHWSHVLAPDTLSKRSPLWMLLNVEKK
jgi:hypothetical protein